MADEEQVQIRLDWGDADKIPAQMANVVLIQGLGADLILTLGHALPTVSMATMSTEQLNEHLKRHPVPVQRTSRFVLPEHAARLLLSSLQGHIRTGEDSMP